MTNKTKWSDLSLNTPFTTWKLQVFRLTLFQNAVVEVRSWRSGWAPPSSQFLQPQTIKQLPSTCISYNKTYIQHADQGTHEITH